MHLQALFHMMRFIDDIISILATLRNDKRDPDRYEQLANEVEEYLINNYNKKHLQVMF